MMIVFCCGMLGCRTPPAAGPQAACCTCQPLELQDNDRIMVLAPHPDDEALAAGGLIQEALARGLPVKVVFLTNGDNNELSFMLYRKRPVLAPAAVRAMGAVRQGEAVMAAAVLGLEPEHLVFLGYPDFGTMSIWEHHWGDVPPFRSMLTHVRAVTYNTALRPGAPYRGEEILKDLESVLRDFRPTLLLLSHPADFNPDHRALYTFTRVALWNLGDAMQPRLYSYLVHFKSWPLPRGYFPAHRIL
ncbi:MAG: PIG-L family deacetylase, partial [Lentisphaerae bacterium]|nr:PIG-L family deacetylase [Lentisphaerota bacterium]